MTISVVVPVFNPDRRLATLAETLLLRGLNLVVIDDGSNSDLPPLGDLSKIGSFHFMRNETNMGIAYSLNVAIDKIKQIWPNTKFIMTCDQDSVIDLENLDNLLQSVLRESCAEFGCLGPGRVTSITYGTFPSKTPQLVPSIIQSFSIFSLSALDQVGMFCQELFIDSVDTEICFRLTDEGFRVLVDPNISINHSIGSGKVLKLFGRTILNAQHNPKRRFYIVRNGFAMLRRYKSTRPSWARVFLRRLVVSSILGVIYGPKRLEQTEAILRGFLAARSFKLR